MTFQIIFILSGLCILFLIWTKIRVLRNRKDSLILALISLGDVKMRDLTHDAAHLYSQGKERGMFFIKKQLPLHSRNLLNKSLQLTKEKSAILIDDIKKSSIFKKDEGISEFFKALSDKEAEDSIQADFQKSEEEVK